MSLAWLKLNIVLGSIGKLAAAGLLLTTLGLSGCGDDPPKHGINKGCTLNSDCNGGLVCSFGLCHQECQITTDCPAGQRCVKTDDSNVCQLDDEAACHFKSDCQEPLVCAIDLQCRNQCQKDLDCLKGQQCADGVCAEPAEVTEDGGLKGAVGTGGAGGEGPGPSKGGSSGNGGTANVGGDDAGGANQGGAPTTDPCVPGGECAVQGEPCQVGVLACDANGQAVCEGLTDAEDGVDCGTDQVCSAGECVACTAGEACQPDANNDCVAGEISCATGPSCETAGNVTNGTECGTDQVCSAGSCVACKAGEACDPAGQPCKNGTLACSNGPVCQATGNKSGGTECGTDQVCTSNGVCAACVQDGACTPTNVCHQGQQDCATGPNCVDTQLAGNEGNSCPGNATYNFCTAGACIACQNGNACVPTNPCHKGTLNCATNPPTCNDSNTNATDGLACGDSKSCISGACLTNDRVLSVTSGAVPDTAIDNSFTSVTVKLVDSNNANVAGAAVTVVPSAGAYAVASAATNASGVAQISGRVGRAVGSYKFTVSAPGASSIEFSVNAIAPAAKSIFTAVNVNHLSGVATPGAGTVSKLNGQARAVVSAADGTLYIADYYSVWQLTPQGVLSRLAGDANGSYGNTGDTGPGTTAKLSTLSGLALDEANGFLYIADQGNLRIRQIELASGTIYGYAGGGANGGKPWGDNGPADSAYLNPSGVSVAPNGDVYISDQTSGSIRKVDYNSGVITTAVPALACSAAGPLALYSCGGWGDACSVAWDKAGKMFISGYMCGGGISTFRAVARVEGDGSLSLVAGSDVVNVAEGGAATTAGFTYSPYLAFDKGGNLFLATQYDHRIRRIDAATTKITTVAGTGTAGFSGDYGVGSSGAVNYPTTLSFDSAGNLHFADATNYGVRTIYGIGSSTVPTATLATTGGTAQTVKRNAAFGALTVKLTDSTPANVSGATIQWKRLETGSGLSASGATSVTSKTGAAGTSSMTGRVGLASGAYKFEASYKDIHGTQVTGSPQTFTVTAEDPVAGHIFPVQNYVHTNGTGGYPGPATFAKQQGFAMGVVAAADGTIYVGDHYAIYKLSPRGEVEVFAGTPGSAGFSGDSGPALGAKLYYPEGLALDETRGFLYIADYQNQRVRMVDLATGVIDTLAGGGSVSTAPFGDGGPAVDANIYYPSSVSVDAAGLVYIGDYGHNRIRVVDPETGIITTWLAGTSPCVQGTVSYYSVPQYGGVVRFTANGDAYITGNICQGTTTNNTLGIVLRAKSNGTMTRIAGLYNGVTTENADATATAIPDLTDFIIDGNGDLVLATYGDDRLRRINMTTGKINTIAGNGTAGYALASDVSAEPGAYVPATSALLYNPFKLALWPGGHVLIADGYNYATRMIW